MLFQIGSPGKAVRGLAGRHADRTDAAFGGCSDRIKTQQGAGRHDDLPAAILRQGNEIGPRQQRAGAEHHHGLAGFEHRPTDLIEELCGRAFDRNVRIGRERRQLDQRTGDAFGVEPGLRLGTVAGGGSGQHQARHAVGKPARQHTTDLAKTGDGDTGHWANLPRIAVIRGPIPGHKQVHGPAPIYGLGLCSMFWPTLKRSRARDKRNVDLTVNRRKLT